MPEIRQLRVGPELLSPSSEAWLATYLFYALVLLIPLLGGLWLPRLEPLPALIAGCALALGSLLALIGAILFHLLGHILDALATPPPPLTPTAPPC